MFIKTDSTLYNIELYKYNTNIKSGPGKSWIFTFKTDRRNVRCAFNIFTNDDGRINVRHGEIDSDYDIISPVYINNREINKFYKTMQYCVEYFSERNPQFLWYDCDNFIID